MKKILSIIVSLAIICSLISSVIAQNVMELYVQADKREVTVGDELILSVYVKNAEELDKVQFTFNYDKRVLNYIGNTKGDVVQDAFVKTIKKVEDGKLGAVATYDPDEAYTGEGILWEFKFEVLDSARTCELQYGITNTLFGSVDVEASEIPGENITYDSVDVEGVEQAIALSVSADNDYAVIGDVVKYTVSISEIAVEGLQFDFDYDENKLELIDAEWLLDDYLLADYSNIDEVVTALVAFDEETVISGDIFEMNSL